MATSWQPRPDRSQASPFVHHRLVEEINQLRTEPSWREGDRDAIMVAKGTGLRLVLTTLRQGTVVREHRAQVPATLHVLTGRTPVRVGDRELQLDPEDIVTLEPRLVHRASALADSAFLMIRADARPPAS